jgi:RNA polymerase sigma-70 factor (ECF subfamily)
MTRKLDELSDEELMVLYQNGDEQAFGRLYARYADRAYGYLRKRLQDPQGANDVFQTAFLKLHRSKVQFNPSFMFAPWLFAIIRTTLVDWQKNHRKVRTQELKEEMAPEFTPENPAVLRSDLLPVPEPQRSAIEMRYFDDLSFEEIANRLETTPSNVRKLVSRGLKSLRSAFAKGGIK